MISNKINFEELFRKISLPQTREHFKKLRSATYEEIASTFQPGPAESEKMKAQLNFSSAPNNPSKRGKKSDLE